MNVLILANKLPFPPRDGGSIATLNMLLGLRHAGMRVTCLAMNTSKHPFPVERIPAKLQSSIRFVGVDCDTSIRPFRLVINYLFSRVPYVAERFNIKAFRMGLQALLEEESFDIIQFEGPYLFFYLDQIRNKSQARISLRAHNSEHLIWKKMALRESSPLKKYYLRNLARRLHAFEMRLLNRVDYLIPISEWDETYFREQGTDTPMLTIPTGLNLEEYPFTEQPSGYTLFFIGALDWMPNQEGLSWFLDQVFGLLTDQLPEIQFHVAGRNAPVRFLKKLDHPNITFHGEVEDARSFIQSYGIMVAPLFSGSGIRIKILEAMALGRPVVTTSTGIAGIPAKHLRTVRVGDDPQTYKKLLLELIKDPKESARSAVEARELISRDFDTFKLSKRLCQFYKAQA
jgi:glycosyltransferase involved in cell wall biosynthesis